MSPAVPQDCDRYDRLWFLDPESGRLSPGPADAFARPAGARLRHGFVHLLSHVTTFGAALYAASSTLRLRYGAERWDTEETSVRCASRLGEAVSLLSPGEGPLRETVLPTPVLGPFDPEYDWTDLLADDFFLWATGQLSGTRHRGVLSEQCPRGFTPA
ncbi:hypothetical protein PUR28_05740 [Streptomyces sp. BE308]|uniref:hypothetical protein n=1 Tax=Streptomyces sp. BE308 TaxID=3002529 RepID=UPI002E7A0ACC|nr:hypothetical protein [Streptomyces sp. BE308]MEE1790285.1 hypothetical protein [Streptomyces sp. BE308]